MLGSNIKSFNPLMFYLIKGFISFLISNISIALDVPTVSMLENDSTFIGISFDNQVLVFFPVLKSNTPHSYSCLDLFSKLTVR